LDQTVTYTESGLVAGLRQQDSQAFNYLYEHYSGAIYSVILQVVPETEAASDLLQEVFVTIWKKAAMYDASKGRLFTWMLNVARNAAIDTLRSKSYKNSQKNREFDSSVHSSSGNMVTNQNIDAIGLRKWVGQLKQDYRSVLELAYFQGFTHEEIAKELNIPLGTVKTRIRTALVQLKEKIL
jgi:RNA polymerase sigma factor (sigma-70 family)